MTEFECPHTCPCTSDDECQHECPCGANADDWLDVLERRGVVTRDPEDAPSCCGQPRDTDGFCTNREYHAIYIPGGCVMTDPNPAQRRDWFTSSHEATHANDQRYGAGHRPAYAKTGAGWTSACGCGNGSCDRAFDDCLYPTWHDAYEAAKTNLELAEHGHGISQEAS